MVPADAPVLTWKQHDKYALVSECGRYSVAKYGVGRVTYEAWRRRAHPLGAKQIAVNLSAAATAKLICEHDHQQTS